MSLFSSKALFWVATLCSISMVPALAQDSHEGHDHGNAEEKEGVVHLSAEQLERFGIVVSPAANGNLHNEVSLPGEIVFNDDHVVHMAPRVSGISREVFKTLGDKVTRGELLAVIDSRELADAKTEYLAAKARAGLAEKTFDIEKNLRENRVSSEQDYLESEQALAEARIQLRSAEQKLHTLGLSDQDQAELQRVNAEDITRYEIRSPIDGVVTEKHMARGETLDSNTHIFTIADTRNVWANLTVYTKHLATVSADQEVILQVDHSGEQAKGTVEMVTPFVDEITRSATARVVLDNSDGRWMPGTFVTGFVSTVATNVPVVVPKTAVQRIEDQDVVFVQHQGDFEMLAVGLGRSDRTQIEITSGLNPGTLYVSEGAFHLKATVITSNLGSHAGHGH